MASTAFWSIYKVATAKPKKGKKNVIANYWNSHITEPIKTKAIDAALAANRKGHFITGKNMPNSFKEKFGIPKNLPPEQLQEAMDNARAKHRPGTGPGAKFDVGIVTNVNGERVDAIAQGRTNKKGDKIVDDTVVIGGGAVKITKHAEQAKQPGGFFDIPTYSEPKTKRVIVDRQEADGTKKRLVMQDDGKGKMKVVASRKGTQDQKWHSKQVITPKKPVPFEGKKYDLGDIFKAAEKGKPPIKDGWKKYKDDKAAHRIKPVNPIGKPPSQDVRPHLPLIDWLEPQYVFPVLIGGYVLIAYVSRPRAPPTPEIVYV